MIEQGELDELERRVQVALRTGDESGLDVLGYGEISLVLRLRSAGGGEFACKRMPVFPDRAAVERYVALLERYLRELAGAGVEVVPTTAMTTAIPGGGTGVGVWCIQPTADAATLGPAVLRGADPAAGHPLLAAIVERANATVSSRLGLDAQVSNWAWVDGRPVYFDVTTPMLAGPNGRALLDTGIFLASFPWAMRAALDRFVVPGVIGRYHDRRLVLTDVASNFLKERLEPWLTPYLALANAVLDEPITEADVRRDYRGDARLWEVMLRLRRLDRAWQRRVRRRTYPFLLPRDVER